MNIKRTFICIIALLITSNISAQNIKLALNDSCDFVSEEGKNYFIVEYPGKTAHEIYEGIYTNIVKIYNDAKDVTNSVPDKAISVRAFSNCLIKYCWWKEPKKFTIGKAALAYVTAGVSFAVDAIKTGNWSNGSYNLAGFYKLNIEVKDGKAKIDAPIMDGISSIYYIDGSKSIDVSEFNFKKAVLINRDQAVATRDSKKEKAKEANQKKELYLSECISQMETFLNKIAKLPETNW